MALSCCRDGAGDGGWGTWGTLTVSLRSPHSPSSPTAEGPTQLLLSNSLQVWQILQTISAEIYSASSPAKPFPYFSLTKAAPKQQAAGSPGRPCRKHPTGSF